MILKILEVLGRPSKKIKTQENIVLNWKVDLHWTFYNLAIIEKTWSAYFNGTAFQIKGSLCRADGADSARG